MPALDFVPWQTPPIRSSNPLLQGRPGACYHRPFPLAAVMKPRPSKKWSIALWAVVAAGAVALSYIITVCLALVCLALPVLWIAGGASGIGGLLLALFGVIVGITILWSLVPRRDKFEPPGVLIDLSEEKRLAKEIGTIANSLGESMPAEVYLIASAKRVGRTTGRVDGRRGAAVLWVLAFRSCRF